jgi:hypothetical protein
MKRKRSMGFLQHQGNTTGNEETEGGATNEGSSAVGGSSGSSDGGGGWQRLEGRAGDVASSSVTG